MTVIVFLGRLLFISSAIFLYYRASAVIIGALSRYIVNHLSLRSRYSHRDLNNILSLPLGGISQAVFCYILILVTHTGPRQLGFGQFQPILLAYGLVLGLGEMALGTFFCEIAMRIANPFITKGPIDFLDWLMIAKGGWMQKYLKTMEIVPLPLAYAGILLYVSIEEIVFRSVLITYFLPVGALAALSIEVVLFVLVQTFHMPGWRAAMFPVIGGIVIGIIHGLLFIAVPEIVPLIIAHFVFFITAVL